MEQEENMTVAVIDDNGEWRKILSSMVKEAIPSACINVFGSVRAFVADNTHYNLVIADVVLAEKEVFAYAEILERRVDYVVYASVIKEKATFAYFPKTVGFISKLDDRTENVCKIKGIHDRFLVKILTFDTEYGKVNVNPDAIIMMNVESRDIKVAMENKKELILKRTSMRKMLPFIEPFLVCAKKGIFINPRHIVRIYANKVVLTHGMEVALSRRQADEVIERFKRLFI